MRVLFVEDNEVNRRVVREMLTAGGIEMFEAEDGAAGLKMIEANDYDLVLMDLPRSATSALAPTTRRRCR